VKLLSDHWGYEAADAAGHFSTQPRQAPREEVQQISTSGGFLHCVDLRKGTKGTPTRKLYEIVLLWSVSLQLVLGLVVGRFINTSGRVSPCWINKKFSESSMLWVLTIVDPSRIGTTTAIIAIKWQDLLHNQPWNRTGYYVYLRLIIIHGQTPCQSPAINEQPLPRSEVGTTGTGCLLRS